jgi:hypothetical protein
LSPNRHASPVATEVKEMLDDLRELLRDAALGGGEVNVEVNNYNPVGVSDADSTNRDMRKLSALGVFARR